MTELQKDTSPSCPYCGRAAQFDAVELWPGRRYCLSCIQQVAPELCTRSHLVAPLTETISPDEIRAWTFIKRYGLQLMMVLAVFPGIPALLFAISIPDAWVGSVLVIALFGGLATFILIIQTLVGSKGQRAQLPRTIEVDGDSLAITRPKGTARISLKDCRWSIGSTSSDMVFAFTGPNRAVVLVTPDERVACGRTCQMSDQWRAFLTLERIPNYYNPGCLSVILFVILGAFIGGTAGLFLGKVIVANNGGQPLVLGLLILGVIDGGTSVALYLTSTFDGFKSARKRLHPAMLGLVFFVLGMKCNAIGGLPAALTFGSANALVGIGIGWLCRRRVKQFENGGKVLRLYTSDGQSLSRPH
jgi:hypothetical protein